MKAMKIPVSKFQFPTPPNGDTIDEAEDRLKLLKALDSNGEVTPLGKAMAYYPINPRQSKMLLTVIEILNMKQSYSRANLVLAYAVAAAAALSVSNPFDSPFEDSHIKN
ncbi:putative RNA helicase [Rosa chinensis]|uniref:RNA helicase n=1 Tax=Rosa chinensis TaxID=74649 RepID=A0A2P6S4L6_ROSCH|nr:putative RNA helicase [Rosa chinensis]